MKLYTEEQVMNLFEKFQTHLPFHYEILVKEHMKHLTHIELPSDEEIYIEAQVKKDNIKILPFDTASFQFGALWLRDKIQGGNK